MHRYGACIKCAECCGYPTPDGSQTAAWPESWPEGVRNWDPEYLKRSIPLFRVITHPDHGGEHYGRLSLHGKDHPWIWIPDHGLCTDLEPYGNPLYYDQRCPFLEGKLCGLVGTPYEFIHTEHCILYPPTQAEPWMIEEFKKLLPSCSQHYR